MPPENLDEFRHTINLAIHIQAHNLIACKHAID